MQNFRLLLWVIIAIGVLARVYAVSMNADPHGDVHLDVLTLDSFAAGEGLSTPLERSVEFYPRDDWSAASYPLDQHPPVVVLLGRVARLITGDSYRALQVVSFVAGLLLLVAAGGLASRWYGREYGLVAAAWVASSFLLADFAGNGSIYTLQTLWGLLAVGALSRPGIGWGGVSGALIGVAYLTNYQSLAYLPALWIGEGVARGRRGELGRFAARSFAIGVGFALVAAPWWWRNLELFGDPTFSVNPIYAKAWFGALLEVVERGGSNLLIVSDPTPLAVLKAMRGIVVVNSRGLALQTSWWLATLIGLGAIGGVMALRSTRRTKDAAPAALVAMALLHLATSLFWPAMKFRYLVPLIGMLVLLAVAPVATPAPRVARWSGLAAWGFIAVVALERLARGGGPDGLLLLVAVALFGIPLLGRAGSRPIPLWLGLVPFVFAQATLFGVATPKSTYYDGILLSDAFGRKGEEGQDRLRQADLAEMAREIAAREIDALFANIELKVHLRRAGSEARVIQLPIQPAGAPLDLEVMKRARNTHQADYMMVLSVAEMEFYREILAEEVMRVGTGDDSLVLFRLIDA